MSDLIITERQNIVDIADAVRNKTGSNEPMTISGIVENINSISVSDGGSTGGSSSDTNLFNYISSSWTGSFKLMFYKVVFPDGYEITLNVTNAPTNINSMFRLAENLRKITFIVPTDRVYDARYFLTTDSSATPTLEELVLPDEIKFSAFDYFASYARKLHTITGTIDLSESTSNLNCFMYCTDLVEVRFVQESITKDFYIKQSSKLSDASIASIVEGLADLTGQETQTLTVHATVAGKIEEWGKKASIESKNWTLKS